MKNHIYAGALGGAEIGSIFGPIGTAAGAALGASAAAIGGLYAFEKIQHALSEAAKPNNTAGISGENGVSVGKDVVGSDHDTVRPTQDKVNPEIVKDYIGKIQNGENIRPVEIVRTPSGDYLVDGHHRYTAGQACGKEVPANITEGSGLVGMPNWKDVKWENFNPQ